MTRMGTRTPILIIASALAATLAFAQDQPPQGEGPDVPGRAARLSFLSGSVTFQPGSVEDWVPATLNRPITTGDRIWTDNGSRAELHLGNAAFRLNGRTGFSFINLDDRMAQVQLSQGSLEVRVRRLADDESMEIDTPQAALTILRAGEYRVDVNDQGDATIVTVRGGEMEATAGQAFTIHPRDQVRITGGGDGAPATFDRREMPVGDPFDNFCADRDRREDRSESARYVSREMPGYADLDDNGGWRQYPEYGEVWFPRGVAVGWAPYRFGHWAWVAPWGWTWIDDAPWGYAPFHYGRWVSVGGAWGWVPGPVVVGVRPVYAPALVAWVGGPRFGVSIGIGGGAAVGWFALGPREVFVPSYHYSPAYVERVNVTNTVIVNRTVINNVNVTNVTYVNRGVPGAVTAVSHETMISGRPVGLAAVRVEPGALQQAQVIQRASVAPQREAVLGGRAAVGAPPAAMMNRTVVTRTAPPPAPVAFEHQRTALQANPGRPLDRAAENQVRSSAPQPVRPAQPMYRQALPNNQPQQRPAFERNNTPQLPQQQPQQRPPFERNNTPPAAQPPQQQPQQRPPFERNNTPPPAQPPQQQPPQRPPFERNNTPPPAQPQQQQPPQRPPFERNNTPPPAQPPQQEPQQRPPFERNNTPPPAQPPQQQPPQQPQRQIERNNTPPPQPRVEPRQEQKQERLPDRPQEKQQKRDERRDKEKEKSR